MFLPEAGACWQPAIAGGGGAPGSQRCCYCGRACANDFDASTFGAVTGVSEIQLLQVRDQMATKSELPFMARENSHGGVNFVCGNAQIAFFA